MPLQKRAIDVQYRTPTKKQGKKKARPRLTETNKSVSRYAEHINSVERTLSQTRNPV